MPHTGGHAGTVHAAAPPADVTPRSHDPADLRRASGRRDHAPSQASRKLRQMQYRQGAACRLDRACCGFMAHTDEETT